MIGFPLLLIPFAIYNIFVFLMPGVVFTAPITSVTLTSGVQWAPTFGDALLALCIVLLLFEVVKAARPGARYLTDHLLSLVVSGAAVAEFLLLVPFGTSTFFLLTVLMTVEFLAGVSIGFRNRHRRVPVDAPAGVPREPAPAPVPVPASPAQAEPSFDQPHQDVKPVEPLPPQPEPETVPKPETAPKPVPTLAVIRNAEGAVAAERKISDWSVSDLVSDHAPESPAKTPPKP
ncbi:MAG: hypothetical protein Q7V17_08210 [Afipia sp.]|nr:hypothetical protein [Afipia sp.]